MLCSLGPASELISPCPFNKASSAAHAENRIKACMTVPRVARRELLRLGGIAAAAELASLALHGCGSVSGPSPGSLPPPPACAKLSDIDHVIILIQENRSFDHYFGSYRGVRGFSDQSAAFQQPDPANTAAPPLA